MIQVDSNSLLKADWSRADCPGTARVDTVTLPFEPSRTVESRTNRPLNRSLAFARPTGIEALPLATEAALIEEQMTVEREQKKFEKLEAFLKLTQDRVLQRKQLARFDRKNENYMASQVQAVTGLSSANESPSKKSAKQWRLEADILLADERPATAKGRLEERKGVKPEQRQDLPKRPKYSSNPKDKAKLSNLAPPSQGLKNKSGPTNRGLSSEGQRDHPTTKVNQGKQQTSLHSLKPSRQEDSKQGVSKEQISQTKKKLDFVTDKQTDKENRTSQPTPYSGKFPINSQAPRSFSNGPIPKQEESIDFEISQDNSFDLISGFKEKIPKEKKPKEPKEKKPKEPSKEKKPKSPEKATVNTAAKFNKKLAKINQLPETVRAKNIEKLKEKYPDNFHAQEEVKEVVRVKPAINYSQRHLEAVRFTAALKALAKSKMNDSFAADMPLICTCSAKLRKMGKCANNCLFYERTQEYHRALSEVIASSS